MSDERVQQVIDELDPTPASEVAWPVSRRQTLRALAAAGLLGAGSGSASAESAGGVIADEAVFSNYGSESVSDGWELTIDDDVFALTASEDTIGLPDGGVGEEVVLPNGVEASEMIAPDGSVVFDPIPDGLVLSYPWNEGSGTSINEEFGRDVATLSDDSVWTEGDWFGDFALDFRGNEESVSGDSTPIEDAIQSGHFGVSFTFQSDDLETFDSFLGVSDNGRVASRSGFRGDGGSVEFNIQDSNGHDIEVYTDGGFDDGANKRVFITMDQPNADGISIFINDSEEPLTADSDDSGFDLSDVNISGEEMLYGDGPGTGAEVNAIMDYPRWWQSPSRDDIAEDFDLQPWS